MWQFFLFRIEVASVVQEKHGLIALYSVKSVVSFFGRKDENVTEKGGLLGFGR